MKHLLAIIASLIVLISMQLASAAVIKGSVYDFSLEEIEAVVEINTSPLQKMVAKEFYSFEVPDGSYTLKAQQIVDGIVDASVEEIITVTGQGTFVRDLILFPEIGLNEDLDEIQINPEELDYKESSSKSWIAFLVLLVAVFIAYKLTKPDDSAKKTRKFHPELDDEAQKIYSFICKQKRTTQKEIRKEFPHSEAKVSLIIAELEEKSLVKKIKKGRGNIIIRC